MTISCTFLNTLRKTMSCYSNPATALIVGTGIGARTSSGDLTLFTAVSVVFQLNCRAY